MLDFMVLCCSSPSAEVIVSDPTRLRTRTITKRGTRTIAKRRFVQRFATYTATDCTPARAAYTFDEAANSLI